MKLLAGRFFTFVFLLGLGLPAQGAILYSENFNDPAINGKGNNAGTTDMSGVTNFTIDTTAAALLGSDWFRVTNALLQGRDTDGPCIFQSPVISLSGYSNIWITLNASEVGGLEAADYLDLSYSLDSGGYITLTNWAGLGNGIHTLIDDFTAAAVSVSNLNGGTLALRVTMRNDSANEYLQADDILIQGTTAVLPTNIPPALAPIGPKSVVVSNTFFFGLSATPTDGDTLTLSMSNAPAGAILYVTNNSATFNWTPPTPTGIHTVTFYASDKDGSDSELVNITVTPRLSSFDVMAANLSGQTGPCSTAYTDAGARIFKGLAPDVVAIQEWNVTNAAGRREWVDKNFGTNYSFFAEPPDPSCPMPNGIISRWPIVDSGVWNDPEVFNRDFAWATISVPGANPLHVVSVHLKAGTAGADIATREIQAQALTNLIAQNFSKTNFIILAGDLNLMSRAETTLAILTNALSDGHQPADQNGDKDTNIPRDRPYDLVLPNPALNANMIPVVKSPHTFNNGMVFDSREWATPPSPILAGDSAALGIQHLPVVKRFNFNYIDQPPVLSAIGNKSLLLSNGLSFAVTAVSTENDPVTLLASNLPPGAVFSSAGENGSFSWLSAVPAGIYTTTFYAVDNDGTDFETITINVVGQSDLIISEIADPIDNAVGRFVEIYVPGTSTINLASENYHLARQLNGQAGSWFDVALTGTIAQGEAYVIGLDVTNFPIIYGFAPDQVDKNVVDGNGDDTYALFKGGDYANGALIDVFGEVNVDGSSEDWAYADKRVYRNETIVRPNTTWTSSEWTFVSSATVSSMSPGYHGSNAPPILAGIGNKYTFDGGYVEFGVSATLTTGDPATLSVSNAPAGSVFSVTNQSGSFSWIPASPMGVYTMTFYAIDEDGFDSETITITVGAHPPNLIISEVADPLDNTTGRFVEVYNPNPFTVNFASNIYFLGRQINGGLTWDEVQLTGTVAAGATYVLANNQAGFFGMYGVNAQMDLPGSGGNGDDGYFLWAFGDHSAGALMDAYGDVDTSGAGQPWDYTDKRAVRNSNIAQPNPIWSASEWTLLANANATNMTPGVHSVPPFQPPYLSPIGNKTVNRSNALSFTVSAFDQVDSDSISLYATGLPPGATFPSNTMAAGITGTFNWVSAAPAGVYTTTFWAVDGDGSDSETITITVSVPLPAGTPWINEYHYDNTGTDNEEGVEIAGPAGFDLAGFAVYRVEGSTAASGTIDQVYSISGILPDDGCGYGAIWIATTNNENGPDGYALVDAATNLVDFISYEGPIDGRTGAINGVAATLALTELTTQALGLDMQLTGTGTSKTEFIWSGPVAKSLGAMNAGQSIPGCSLTNYSPVIAAIGNRTGTNGFQITFNVTVSENDGDAIGVWATGLPSGSTFTPVTNIGSVTNTFTWNPATPAGVYTTTFWAVDKDGSDSETIVITVNPQTPPILAIGPKTTTVLSPLLFGITATPTDGDTVTLTASNLPSGAAFYPTNQFATFEWPAPSPAGTYTVVVWATDNDGPTNEPVVISVNPPAPNITNIWINELHYDNAGVDTNEGIELAGLAGLNLANFSILRYEGGPTSSGAYEGVTSLAGVLDDEACGYGAVWQAVVLENGPADALALVDQNTNLIQFISYGNPITATNGPLSALTSTLLPVSESSSTPVGQSLQLTGTGTNAVNFSWSGPTNHSRGSLNASQFISGCVPTNLPPTLSPLGNTNVTENGVLQFLVIAQDPTDRDSVTLYATAIPIGASFPSNTMVEGVTNTFSWNPAMPAGVYTTTFWAVDNDGINSATILITVSPLPPPADGDSDGMPDQWELDNGLNPANPADASSDTDTDGFTALQEWISYTEPTNGNSFLKLENIQMGGGGTPNNQIKWKSASNRIYGVWLQGDLLNGPVLYTNGIASTPPTNSLPNTTSSSNGFFRLQVEVAP